MKPEGVTVQSDLYSGRERVTRRSILKALTGIFPLWLYRSVDGFAEPAGSGLASPGADFLEVSFALTNRTTLSKVIGQKLFLALASSDKDFSSALTILRKLLKKGQTPQNLLEIARSVGLDKTAISIVSAWYTGTVTTPSGSVFVTYDEALMYSPVADGLSIPTFCPNGPLWWKNEPPEIGVLPPLEAEKQRIRQSALHPAISTLPNLW